MERTWSSGTEDESASAPESARTYIARTSKELAHQAMLNAKASCDDWESLTPDEKRKEVEKEGAKLRLEELELKQQAAMEAAKEAEARRKKSPVLVAFNEEDRVRIHALFTVWGERDNSTFRF